MSTHSLSEMGGSVMGGTLSEPIELTALSLDASIRSSVDVAPPAPSTVQLGVALWAVLGGGGGGPWGGAPTAVRLVGGTVVSITRIEYIPKLK